MFLIIRYMILVLAAAALATVAAILIHELGHLLAGRLSGYGCCGIACLGLSCVRVRGKWRIKLGKRIPAGRCWLYPLSGSSNPIPAAAGGCMANIAVGILLLTASYIRASFDDPVIVFIVSGFMNLYLGICNLTEGSAFSDGNTVKELKHSKKARLCYDRILLAEKHLMDGKPLKNLSEDFYAPARDYAGSLGTELGLYAYLADNEVFVTDNAVDREAVREHIRRMEKGLDRLALPDEDGIFADEINCERQILKCMTDCLHRDRENANSESVRDRRSEREVLMKALREYPEKERPGKRTSVLKLKMEGSGKSESPRELLRWAMLSMDAAPDKTEAIREACRACESAAAASMYPGLWRFTALEIIDYGLEILGNDISLQSCGCCGSGSADADYTCPVDLWDPADSLRQPGLQGG